jgi:hypothetical protein
MDAFLSDNPATAAAIAKQQTSLFYHQLAKEERFHQYAFAKAYRLATNRTDGPMLLIPDRGLNRRFQRLALGFFAG